MKNEPLYVKVDSRNRVVLTRVSKKLSSMYKVRMQGETIILEPVVEIPAEEAWLFASENKDLLARIKQGIEEGGTIDLGSFKKHIE